jgi:hypothetical protein
VGWLGKQPPRTLLVENAARHFPGFAISLHAQFSLLAQVRPAIVSIVCSLYSAYYDLNYIVISSWGGDLPDRPNPTIGRSRAIKKSAMTTIPKRRCGKANSGSSDTCPSASLLLL